MIVLDSSFLIAFHNERDSHHEVACGLMREFLDGRWEMGLLPEHVFLEVVTVLLVRRDLATAIRTGRLLLEAKELEFVPFCPDIDSRSTRSHMGVPQAFVVTDIDNHRVKTALEPPEKRIQVPFLRPNGRITMPPVQLLLEDLVADLCEVFQRLLVSLPFPQEIYGRLQSQVFQCQMRAGWIHSVEPVQERLCRSYNNSGSVNRVHSG